MSHNVRKHTSRHVCPAKIQIGLRILAVWSKSSLGAFWVASDAKFFNAYNEDSNHTALHRLIWVFVICTCFLTLRLIIVSLRAHNVETTPIQRWFNVEDVESTLNRRDLNIVPWLWIYVESTWFKRCALTLNQQWIDGVLTLCACWVLCFLVCNRFISLVNQCSTRFYYA